MDGAQLAELMIDHGGWGHTGEALRDNLIVGKQK
jgi:hypothetical protein